MILELDLPTGVFMEKPAPNFSYYEIPAGCCIRIYEYQQMIVHDELLISGELHLDGELVLIN